MSLLVRECYLQCGTRRHVTHYEATFSVTNQPWVS